MSAQYKGNLDLGEVANACQLIARNSSSELIKVEGNKIYIRNKKPKPSPFYEEWNNGDINEWHSLDNIEIPVRVPILALNSKGIFTHYCESGGWFGHYWSSEYNDDKLDTHGTIYTYIDLDLEEKNVKIAAANAMLLDKIKMHAGPPFVLDDMIERGRIMGAYHIGFNRRWISDKTVQDKYMELIDQFIPQIH